MSGPIRRFDPSEVRDPGQPAPPRAEQADALLAARELESLAGNALIRPTEGFADRVMAVIATEPAPRLVVKPAAMVRGGRVGAFVIAVREAWGVATSGGRPMAVRAQALAFVLLVVVAAGSLTSAAAIGVGGLLNAERSSTPSLEPGPTGPETPDGVATQTAEPTDSDSAEPSESPEASDAVEPSEGPEATETAEPGDTGGTSTDRPTKTPHETEKPESTHSPEPTEDHGAGGGESHSPKPS